MLFVQFTTLGMEYFLTDKQAFIGMFPPVTDFMESFLL